VAAKHDLTLTELMEVAREVGLDPLAVRRSASIESVAGTGVLAAALGAPDRREVRATMHGVCRMTAATWLARRNACSAAQV